MSVGTVYPGYQKSVAWRRRQRLRLSNKTQRLDIVHHEETLILVLLRVPAVYRRAISEMAEAIIEGTRDDRS